MMRFARSLMERIDPVTAGLWPRATALLTRQRLEESLDDLWRLRAPGLEQCSMKAQLLCLPHYLGDEKLGEHVSYAWAGLSRACHQHPYELPPTSMELQNWLQTADQLIAKVCAIQTGAAGS